VAVAATVAAADYLFVTYPGKEAHKRLYFRRESSGS
jgi:hypothetical protein